MSIRICCWPFNSFLSLKQRDVFPGNKIRWQPSSTPNVPYPWRRRQSSFELECRYPWKRWIRLLLLQFGTLRDKGCLSPSKSCFSLFVNWTPPLIRRIDDLSNSFLSIWMWTLWELFKSLGDGFNRRNQCPSTQRSLAEESQEKSSHRKMICFPELRTSIVSLLLSRWNDSIIRREASGANLSKLSSYIPLSERPAWGE